jgi:hypothetical protein
MWINRLDRQSFLTPPLVKIDYIEIKTLFYEYIVTCISVAREQVGTHVPAKKNFWSTIGKGLSIARQRAVNKFRQH